MEQNNQNPPTPVRSDSADFGTMRNDSEAFRKLPKSSEGFGSVPKPSERKENHTLTVREVARMFEVAGVARTERSVTNWCQPNKSGVARLDSYFDPNERKYYISPQSVKLAIAEEKAKAAKSTLSSEPVSAVPKSSERTQHQPQGGSEEGTSRVRELEKQVFDLQITNRGKDYLVEQLQKERDGFFDQLLQASRKVGELETKLLQLEGPKNRPETGQGQN